MDTEHISDLPLIDQWAVYVVPVQAPSPNEGSRCRPPAIVVGTVKGRPGNQDGEVIRTSLIRWIDLVNLEVQTQNTRYVLAQPLPARADYRWFSPCQRIEPDELAMYEREGGQ
jgi:hypothetical protein